MGGVVAGGRTYIAPRLIDKGPASWRRESDRAEPGSGSSLRGCVHRVDFAGARELFVDLDAIRGSFTASWVVGPAALSANQWRASQPNIEIRFHQPTCAGAPTATQAWASRPGAEGFAKPAPNVARPGRRPPSSSCGAVSEWRSCTPTRSSGRRRPPGGRPATGGDAPSPEKRRAGLSRWRWPSRPAC